MSGTYKCFDYMRASTSFLRADSKVPIYLPGYIYYFTSESSYEHTFAGLVKKKLL